MANTIEMPEPRGMAEAEAAVRAYVDAKYQDVLPEPNYTISIVWFFSQGRNWKALVGTTIPDDMFYEVNYSYGKLMTTLDAYMKVDSITVS